MNTRIRETEIAHEALGVVLEPAPCPNGCVSQSELLFLAHDRLFGLPGEFRIMRCMLCGLIRTDPRPTQGTIGIYYPENQYCAFQSQTDRTGKSASLLKRMLKTLHQNLIQDRAHAVPDIAPGRMLEIGCSSGSFLAQMAERNWRVEGIELTECVAQRAQAAGFKVFCGPLESAPDPDYLFDLVTGWMVVEHLHQPLHALRKLADWTRPGGWLAISVPNATNLHLRIFGDNWFALQVPTHLYHFSEASIVTLLQASGWHVERVLHQRSLCNIAYSIGLALEAHGAPKWLHMLPNRVVGSPRRRLVLYPLSCLLAALKQTGLITVWARK